MWHGGVVLEPLAPEPYRESEGVKLFEGAIGRQVAGAEVKWATRRPDVKRVDHDHFLDWKSGN